MYSLIVTVISIALLSVSLSIGINYIDTDKVLAKNKAISIQNSIDSLGLGMITYKNLTKHEANNPSLIVPTFSSVNLSSPNVSLTKIGVEDYLGIPNVRFACFSVENANESDRLMYEKLNSDNTSDKVLLVNNCNNKSDSLVVSKSLTNFNIKFYYL